ncbi:glutathione S-transferase [Neptunomonas qingdaonensis]|uniref:Glutathione S-transferase n=2 Tax=Neptunomonas qingdaonensis TaxID=1045558 RepID=A0A1I2ULS4_9GAMM|nr:glutathione S-transferase [Neptunomonas qingdaonensis]
MATHAMLEELGVDYQLVEIDLTRQMQKTPEYLAINPNGKVPTLLHDGHIIYESAAILIYLLDQHPESGLSPLTTSPQRGRYYQSLIWMSNTLQEAANRWAHPEHYCDNTAGQHSLQAKASQELERCWQVIEKDLHEKGPWILGDTLSGADFHLFMIAYWSRRYERRAQDYPKLQQLLRTLLNRSSIQAMLKQEGLFFEL